MSFDRRLTERIPKRDDDGKGHPLKNCPKCGSNDVSLWDTPAIAQTDWHNPKASAKCNRCGYLVSGGSVTIAVGLWNKST